MTLFLILWAILGFVALRSFEPQYNINGPQALFAIILGGPLVWIIFLIYCIWRALGEIK